MQHRFAQGRTAPDCPKLAQSRSTQQHRFNKGWAAPTCPTLAQSRSTHQARTSKHDFFPRAAGEALPSNSPVISGQSSNSSHSSSAVDPPTVTSRQPREARAYATPFRPRPDGACVPNASTGQEHAATPFQQRPDGAYVPNASTEQEHASSANQQA